MGKEMIKRKSRMISVNDYISAYIFFEKKKILNILVLDDPYAALF